MKKDTESTYAIECIKHRQQLERDGYELGKDGLPKLHDFTVSDVPRLDGYEFNPQFRKKKDEIKLIPCMTDEYIIFTEEEYNRAVKRKAIRKGIYIPLMLKAYAEPKKI